MDKLQYHKVPRVDRLFVLGPADGRVLRISMYADHYNFVEQEELIQSLTPENQSEIALDSLKFFRYRTCSLQFKDGSITIMIPLGTSAFEAFSRLIQYYKVP